MLVMVIFLLQHCNSELWRFSGWFEARSRFCSYSLTYKNQHTSRVLLQFCSILFNRVIRDLKNIHIFFLLINKHTQIKCWILCIFHIMIHYTKQEIDSFLAVCASLPDVPISVTVTAEHPGSEFLLCFRKYQV